MNQSTKKKLLNFRSAGLFDIKQSEYILMKYKDIKRLQQIYEGVIYVSIYGTWCISQI